MITSLHGAGAPPAPVPRRPLGRTVLGAAAAGYLFPAVTTTANALLVPVPELAAQLTVAAWTTLGIPSAVASVLATVWYRSRTPPTRPSARTTLAAVLRSALVLAALSGAVTAVLVAHGLLHPAALQFTLSAAAIGGGLPARRWARTHRTRRSADGHPTAPRKDRS
jgi:hypothetical protein